MELGKKQKTEEKKFISWWISPKIIFQHENSKQCCKYNMYYTIL